MEQVEQQDNSLNDAARFMGETAKVVGRKIGEAVKSAAFDLIAAAATGGTSLLAKGAKFLLDSKNKLDKVKSIDKINFLGKSKLSWEKIAAIGLCSLLAFLLITITTIAGAFIPGGGETGGETEPPGSTIVLNGDLLEYFRSVAKNRCLPLAMLLAISKQEAGGIWTYSKEEVEKFNTDGWWNNATNEEKKRGYCYNTCADPTLGCKSYNVTGPMQFEENTWASLVPEDDTPNHLLRCKLDLAVDTAARKLKNDSGTGADECINWGEATVRKTALRYCGYCDGRRACTDPYGNVYCDLIWGYYQEYLKQYPNE